MPTETEATPDRSLSLTARLAILFAAMASGLLIVVGIAVDRAVSAHFDELDRHELSAKLTAIGTLIGSVSDETALDALPRRLDDALAGHDTVALRVEIPRLGWTHTLQVEHFATAGQAPGNQDAVRKWHDGQGQLFIGSGTTIALPLPEPVIAEVTLGLDITHHAHFLRTMRLQLGAGISAAALLAAMLGWLAARKGLAPLRTVTATASRLSAERLGERLSVRDAPPEMRALVEAFNGMLERLETAFRRLGDFSADIAHELRTPVSNLMTETQVALSRSRGADDYREVLHSNLEEFDRLARMISDMLFLAKADNGLLPRPAETVDLHDEARALLEFYDALAEENGIRLTLEGTASATGDRLMLRRALSNLLSNAIRHTPRGGEIGISIEASEGTAKPVAIEVRNPGEPIPPDRLPLLFERFYRLDPSRARTGDGAGLGLAITRSIVDAHGGSIGITSTDGWTTVRIELPGKRAARLA